LVAVAGLQTSLSPSSRQSASFRNNAKCNLQRRAVGEVRPEDWQETLIDADPDYDLSEVLVSNRTNQLFGTPTIKID
jgi:hypothetical protein